MTKEDTENFDQFKASVKELLQHLLEVSSEKPGIILNSTDGQSKWRRGWFASVLGSIDMLGIKFFESDKELNKRINEARESWTQGEMRSRNSTVQSDIDQADALIEDVLKFLEK